MRLFIAWALGAVLAGCAYSYTEPDGTRRVIGLVDLEIEPSGENMPVAGNVLDIETLGFAFNRGPQGSRVTIGYGRSVTAALRDDSLVLGNPLTIRRGNHAQKAGMACGTDCSHDLRRADVARCTGELR
jgi:hypothetical protein